MKIKPGEGERRAATGFRNQYLVGASKILSALSVGQLEWVRVADPNAGRVDDLQIASGPRIDAYQVKWHQYETSFTLNDLVHNSGVLPSLIQQLSDGWVRLQRQYPTRRVVVHLVTNAYPSSSLGARMPVAHSAPKPYHLAAFIEQAWNPSQLKGGIIKNGEWDEVWNVLQTESKLSFDDFRDFILNCSLDFRTQLPIENSDILAIVNLLFSTAAGGERRIQINYDELLSKLGWTRRYDYLNRHVFPLPPFRYQPIQSTVNSIKDGITKHSGGYFGVFGSPGSGKSTVLTQTLRNLPVRLIPYYAYIPDAQDPTTLRGESINFLHDINLSLERAGFGNSENIDQTDRAAAQKHFYEQLDRLGQDYRKTGIKTVILVDGLDHIAREQHPDRSLLLDLPLPESIPEGVYIFIGSQTDELPDLPAKVQYSLKQIERRTIMDHLNLTDVISIAETGIPNLSNEQENKIFDISGGHPLALIYLLNSLKVAKTNKEQTAILENAIPYRENIQALYWSHWRMVEDDEGLVHALGLLARFRGPIPMKWVATWLERKTLLKLQKLFLPYFNDEGDERWSFFHNSFRLFLIEQTGKLLPGLTFEQQNNNLYKELADQCAVACVPWNRETLYHLYSAGEHQTVVKVATWELFLSQVRSLRPIDAIITDIRLAIKSAGMVQDGLSLLRLTLIWVGMEQRARSLSERSIVEILIDTKNEYQAAEYLRDGYRLRIDADHAMRLCSRLFRVGLEKESQRVFELAEPVEYLSGKPISRDRTPSGDISKTLKSWIYSALLFRSTEEIIDIIKRIQLEPQISKESGKDDSLELQNWLLFQGAIASCKSYDWDSWKLFFNVLSKRHDDELIFFILLRSSELMLEKGDFEQANYHLTKLEDNYSPEDFGQKLGDRLMDIETRIDIAEIIYKIRHDPIGAQKWIMEIKAIPLIDDSLSFGEKPSIQEIRFRLTQLQYLLGESQEPEKLVHEAEAITHFSDYVEKEEKAGRRQIALAIYQLARLQAQGQKGNSLSPSYFLNEIRWILDLFGTRWNDISIRIRPTLGGVRTEILRFTVSAAARNGEKVIRALQKEFENRWGDSTQSDVWWISLQREIIMEFNQNGCSPHWVEDQLHRIEPIMLNGLDPYGRAEACEEQAKAWLAIKNRDLATECLHRMMDAARGVYSEKDYQLAEWVKWLRRVNTTEPKLAEARIRLLIHRILSVNGSASGVREAAEYLLGVVFRWRPRQAITLFKYFQENDIVAHQDGLTRLLLEALTISPPPLQTILNIITGLLIPFANRAETDLLCAGIVSSYDIFGKDATVETTLYLKQHIETDALRNDRSGWFRGIAEGLNKVGISPQEIDLSQSDYVELSDQNSGSLDKNLYLNSGEKFCVDYAISRIQTLRDLSFYLDHEDKQKTHYFDWATIVEHLSVEIDTADELRKLEILITPRLLSTSIGDTQLSRLYIALSKKFFKMGDLRNSWSYAEKAVQATSPSGWASYWDGGARYAALNQLVIANTEQARKSIIQLYANDLSDRFHYPENLLSNLDSIFGLLLDETRLSDVWHEIEIYLNDLFVSIPEDPQPEIEALLNLPTEDSVENTPSNALADLLCLYLDHPSYVIAQGSVKAIYGCLNGGQPSILNAINKRLFTTDQATERALMAIDAASSESPEIILPFEDSLKRLISSPNFAIRLVASKIYHRTHPTIPIPPLVNREFPAIYQLQIPKLSMYETDWQSRDQCVAKGIGDPAYIVRPFDVELRAISHMAGIPEDNVLFRAAEHFNKIAGNRTWLVGKGSLDEKKPRKFLEDAGLMFAYNKPRIMPARYALAYVISELFDGSLIPIESIPEILLIINNYDPYFISHRPQPRPNYINPIGGISIKSSFDIPKNWLETVENSFHLLHPTYSEGSTILGELTQLKRLEDKWPKEIRSATTRARGALEFWDDLNIESGEPPFFRFNRGISDDYLGLTAPLDHIIIANRSLGYETTEGTWLALNPAVGNELGWRPSGKNWFRWENQNGELMVESRWWTDGLIDNFNRYPHDEVGCGWLLSATPKGYKELKYWAPKLIRGGEIYRSLGWLGDKGINYSYKLLSTI